MTTGLCASGGGFRRRAAGICGFFLERALLIGAAYRSAFLLGVMFHHERMIAGRARSAFDRLVPDRILARRIFGTAVENFPKSGAFFREFAFLALGTLK